MRAYATIGALTGWFALVLQLYLMLAQADGSAGAVFGIVVTFFSFFTILTNLLVALVYTFVALRQDGGGFFRRPSVQAATTVYIAIVSLCYHLLLRKLWHPEGGQ